MLDELDQESTNDGVLNKNPPCFVPVAKQGGISLNAQTPSIFLGAWPPRGKRNLLRNKTGEVGFYWELN